MSRTHHVPGGIWRIALVGALALVAALMAALTSSPPSAEAAFRTAQCQGSDISGRGASFARDAHQVFRLQFQTFFCGGTAPAVNYEALGSGAGRRVVGERTKGTGTADNTTGDRARDQEPRFGMTDEPLNESTSKPQIVAGTGPLDAPNGDESPIHQIPAAVGAVPVLVNFPDGCDVNQLPPASRTPEQDNDNDKKLDDVVRVLFNKTQLDAVFASDEVADNWVEVFPTLGSQGSAESQAACNKQITRVVRFDDSGTTFTFKDYLDRTNRSRMWIPLFTAPAGTDAKTRQWPNAVFGKRSDCLVNGVAQDGPGSQDDATDQLTSGCQSGNGPLVDKLIGTDGSVGYSDISTARTAGLAITPESAITPQFPTGDNDTYWTQAQNGDGGNNESGPLPATNDFVEPTADPNGFRSDGTPGANCVSATFTSVPESTLGNWTEATAANSPSGFGICSLTYGLLFDDYKKAYGLQPNQDSEETKARTVKDYWTAIVSDGGQGVLFGRDYSPLPSSILAISRAGVNAVGFDKDATGGGGTTGGTTTGGTTGGGTTTGTTPPPPPVVPSNVFRIVRTALSSRTGSAVFSIRVPGRGRIAVGGRAGRIKVGRIVRTVSKSGTYKITLKPGTKAKRVLRRKGRLKVKITFTFKPTGGSTRKVTRTVTLKLRRPRR